MNTKLALCNVLGLIGPALCYLPHAQASAIAVNSRSVIYGVPPDIVVPASRYSEVRVPLLMSGLQPAETDTIWGPGYTVSAKGIWVTRTLQGGVTATDENPISVVCNDEMPAGYPGTRFIPFVTSVSPAVQPGIYSFDIHTGRGWMENSSSVEPPNGWRKNGGVTIFVLPKDQPGAADIQFTVTAAAAAYDIPIQSDVLKYGGTLQVSEVVASNGSPCPWELIHDTSTDSWVIRAASETGLPFPAGTSFNVKLDGKPNDSNNLLLEAKGTPGSSSGTIMADGCMQVVSDYSDNNYRAILLTTPLSQVSSLSEPSPCEFGACSPTSVYDTSAKRWKVCHSDGSPYVEGERVMVKILSFGADNDVVSNALSMSFPGNGELARICDTASAAGAGSVALKVGWPASCSTLGAAPWSSGDVVLTSVDTTASAGQYPAQFVFGPFLSYSSSKGWTTDWNNSIAPRPTLTANGARPAPDPLKRTPVYSSTWEGTGSKYASNITSLTAQNRSKDAKDLGIWDFASLSPFKDVAGRNPDGAVAGSPTLISGPSGSGAHFNGTTDAIYVSGLAPLGTDLTACLWYRVNASDVPASGEPPRLLTFQESTRHDLLQIAMTPGGKIGLLKAEGPFNDLIDTISTADGQWHGIQIDRAAEVVGGATRSTFTVLIDGRRVSGPGAMTNPPSAITIGARSQSMFPGTYRDFFKGDLSYLHIFEGQANCAFPNNALGTSRPPSLVLENWPTTMCGKYCTAQNQDDTKHCVDYLQCYLDNACHPGAPCSAPDAVCGVNGKPGGSAPKDIADKVFNCIDNHSGIPMYKIDAGASSSAGTSFTADQYFSGGTVNKVTNSIDWGGNHIILPGLPDDSPMYQSERYGNSTYTLPGLVAGAPYTVRLYFAELYWTATGKRLFDVVINGATVLSSYDIYAATNGRFKPVTREFVANANSSGQLIIKFNSVKDNASIAGIEVVMRSAPVFHTRIDTGSNSYDADSGFGADQYGTGGTMHYAGGVSGIGNALYGSERYGNSTYTIPGLDPGAVHTVRLHFAELYWTAAGKRLFDVTINGTKVLTSFDIYAAANGDHKPLQREFTANADSSGQIVIKFTSVKDNATIEGIEVMAAVAR